MEARVHRYQYAFPTPEVPAWSESVERWYQLDAPAYGFVQAYWQLKSEISTTPGRIWLASPGASNVTDFNFARPPFSPAKFVHTLPNVRSAPLLELMKWSGPLLCVQSDPCTLTTALTEAYGFLQYSDGVSWVLSAIPGKLSQIQIWEIGQFTETSKWDNCYRLDRVQSETGKELLEDAHLILSLEKNETKICLGQGFELQKL